MRTCSPRCLLTEEALIRRFIELDREEVRRMFKLHDLRKTRVWQEAREEGREEGRRLRDREHVERLRANGQTLKEIAQVLGVSMAEVRRLVRR
jgi:predicted transposase/invertase (TIGR01784 family)